jgi:hypothetical protein
MVATFTLLAVALLIFMGYLLEVSAARNTRSTHGKIRSITQSPGACDEACDDGGALTLLTALSGGESSPAHDGMHDSGCAHHDTSGHSFDCGHSFDGGHFGGFDAGGHH